MIQVVEMSITQLRVVGAGLFFLFIFLSGIWLNHSGKPLNRIILTMHQITPFLTMLSTAVTLYLLLGRK